MLWRCGEAVRALQAFVGSASWRNALCVAEQIPLPPDQLALLARDLAGTVLPASWHSAPPHEVLKLCCRFKTCCSFGFIFPPVVSEKLIELRRYTEAAILLEQYAKDCEEAISALITGAVWEEALRLVR